MTETYALSATEIAAPRGRPAPSRRGRRWMPPWPASMPSTPPSTPSSNRCMRKPARRRRTRRRHRPRREAGHPRRRARHHQGQCRPGRLRDHQWPGHPEGPYGEHRQPDDRHSGRPAPSSSAAPIRRRFRCAGSPPTTCTATPKSLEFGHHAWRFLGWCCRGHRGGHRRHRPGFRYRRLRPLPRLCLRHPWVCGPPSAASRPGMPRCPNAISAPS